MSEQNSMPPQYSMVPSITCSVGSLKTAKKGNSRTALDSIGNRLTIMNFVAPELSLMEVTIIRLIPGTTWLLRRRNRAKQHTWIQTNVSLFLSLQTYQALRSAYDRDVNTLALKPQKRMDRRRNLSCQKMWGWGTLLHGKPRICSGCIRNRLPETLKQCMCFTITR